VADLLECVIQIKALEESIPRLQRLLHAPPDAGDPRVAALRETLVEAERRVAGVCQTALNHSGSDFHEFIALRRANLDFLQACTAADLASPVEWPGRSLTTVADLVAIMLANDTEVLGELRRRVTRESSSD
jgi:hypothetical protein